MKRIMIAVAFLFFIGGGCTDNNKAERILSENGYKNIQMTGYNFFACGKEDFYHSGFRATSPNGHTVTGTVCAGILFKNSTIRFE